MEMKVDEAGNSIVPVLACVLKQLCMRNDAQSQEPNRNLSKFHALRAPPISIKDYLNRIAKYAVCSSECFVLALVYIDRIIQSNPNFVVNSLNIHRLLITSVMLAAKFFDDQYFNNAYYAKVGGVPCGEMNSLEVEFLFMTNFTLFVPSEQYRQYHTELCNHAKNATCECNQQHGKIPPLVFPVPDAQGTLNDPLSPHFQDPNDSQQQQFLLQFPSRQSQQQPPQQEQQPRQSNAMMSDTPVVGAASSSAGFDADEELQPVPASASPTAMAF
mmetsp:Transcript_47512/g.93443  ORF Transcript_47512/g.93443 Transcript_47512/m.93443 type:complete len:272 (+) Transcript_47512:154-969(+)|eukprot:CAMPEP_0175095656 /NCGR_PEP_ID=MMETSP0086_2-20121207/4283_1 /TAXON_ID=136419 /ORGANISM="Unknown Unknown, Strain D1" /LENGTH=271 /DNA_ID=CAMNT_0016368941 /DNA_START=155 /DNA_END=970 /DNA_ORIENTATION=+